MQRKKQRPQNIEFIRREPFNTVKKFLHPFLLQFLIIPVVRKSVNKAQVMTLCERCRGNRFYHAILTKCHKDSYAASVVYALESWINIAFGKYDSVRLFISPSRFAKRKARQTWI
jgi:hypothetical protein